MHYATLHQVRQYLGIAPTTDDSRLIRFVNEAVRAIDERQKRRYDARLETRYFDVPCKDLGGIGNYNTGRYTTLDYLRLDDDLLEVTELRNGDGTIIAAADYVLEPYNRSVKHKIQLLPSAGVGWATSVSGDLRKALAVTGYWGFHTRYADAFENSLDAVQNNPLTANATTVTVSDADGVAIDGSLQRFQAGQMWRIGDELVYCAAVNNAGNTCNIVRGYNGAAPAEHAQGTPIYIYRPMDNIVAAATRLVAWRYRQKDVDVFDKSTILGAGVKITPSSMPADVIELLGAPRMPDLR
jgi:hypothetical protein